jgi:hypothetical protein
MQEVSKFHGDLDVNKESILWLLPNLDAVRGDWWYY